MTQPRPCTKARTSKPRRWFPGLPAWDLNDVILWLFPSVSLIPSASSEQLRWLQNGYRIRVGLTDVETIGIDTPEDLTRAEKALGTDLH